MNPGAASRPASIEALVLAASAMLLAVALAWFDVQQVPDAKFVVFASIGNDLWPLMLLGVLPGMLGLARLNTPVWIPRIVFIAAALLLVAQHHFLVKTGMFANGALLAHGVANMGDLGPVLASELDLSFFLRSAAVLPVAWLLLRFAGLLARQEKAWLIGLLLMALPWVLMSWAFRGPSHFSVAGALTSLDPGIRRLLPQPDRPRPEHSYQPPQATSKPVRTPDVIVLIMESTRADAVYGPQPVMPYFALLAAHSLAYERHYTTTSHTAKALVGILCGMYPNRRMGPDDPITAKKPLNCLPHLLGQLGYDTVFLQSANGDFEDRRKSAARFGFSRFLANPELPGNFQKAGYFGMDEMAMLEPLAQSLDEARKQSRPLFLTLLTSITHHPYALPGEREPPEGLSPQQAQERAARYADGFLEKAVQIIDARRSPGETILIVLGDHGEAFGEHLAQQHNAVPYEEVMRTPMILRYPPAVQPGRDTRLRQSIDIAPTVLELLGVQWQGYLPGLSLLEPAGHETVFTNCWYVNYCQTAVGADGMKLIFNFGYFPPELYDLSHDPGETRNLAGEPALRQRMGQAYAGMLMHEAFVEDAY